MIRPLFLLFFSRSSSATSLSDIYCRAYFWVWIIETQMVFFQRFSLCLAVEWNDDNDMARESFNWITVGR